MRIKLVLSLSLLPLALMMSGCGIGDIEKSTPDTVAESGQPMEGSVYGGRQPIVGASIYMYAAGTTGYGSASTSLITNYPGGSFPSSVDSNGNYYITTNSNGGWNLAAGEYSCTVGQQVYIYSIGGQPTPGVTNSAAGLLAVLGTCEAGGTFSAVTSRVNISEISTVAAAYAIAGYASDATDVGSSGTTLALTGIQNAFNNAAQLYNINSANGAVANSTTPNGNGTVPQVELNSLANSIAACVNSSGSSSPSCSGLFGAVESAGSGGTMAGDTATEAIYIAKNPGTNVSTVWANASTTPPWQPTLSSAPNDWTVAITYTDTSLDNPYGTAIDASGNVWVTNSNGATVTELSPTGVVTSGAGVGYTSPDMSQPLGIAIDASGNAWVADGGDYLIEIAPGGSPTEYTGGDFNGTPTGITIDPYGNFWIAQETTKVAEFSSTGTDLLGTTGGKTTKYATATASDASGNIFVANSSTSTTADSVSKFNNAGTALTTGTAYAASLNQHSATSSEMGIAIDKSNNFWIPNYNSGTITELSNTGAAVSGTGVYTGGGLSHPEAIAFDGNSAAWIANNAGCISEFSGSSALSLSSGYAGGTSCSTLSGIQSIAVDGSGNVWVANYNASNVTELLGIATPVVTPIVSNFISPYTHAGSKP